MSDGARRERGVRASRWLKRTWIALVLLGFYVLSAGPAFALYLTGDNGGFDTVIDAFVTVYWPLNRFASECEPFSNALNWYVDLCLPFASRLRDF
jgi:hypothetical protein